MKEFYVMNLDMRRIAILVGGALTVLGLALFIGMAIGRSQGERNARLAAEELQKPASEMTQSADKLVMASGPTEMEVAPSRATAPHRKPADPGMSPIPARKSAEAAVPAIPSVPEAKSEIPLQEDPLVSGPPKKAKKTARKAEEADDEKPAPRLKKSKPKSSKKETEIAGSIEHKVKPKRRKRSQLSEEADEQLASVAGTSKAKTAAGFYTIQVAAFKRSSEAKDLIERLKGEGIKANSEKTGDYYLVTVGRTKSKGKLDKALSRLKELEYEAYIRKLKENSDET